MTADFSFKPTLPGERITLVPLTAEHTPMLLAAVGDPEVRRLTGSQGGLDEAAARSWAASRADTDDRLDLAITDQRDECVGEAVLNAWDPRNLSCNFRILIGPAGHNRGLGTEATRLIVGYGFEKLGLHRISLGVYAFNHRAQRVYEKVGFTREGVEREVLLWDGEWFDAINMSILEQDWACHRGFP